MYSPFCSQSCWQSGCHVCSQHVDNSEHCLQLFQHHREILYKCDNRWNLDPPLHSGVKSAVSCMDNSWWKPSKAFRHKHQQARFWPPYFEMPKVFCSITLNGHKWRRKKCSFTKTMHRVTSQSQWWQNYMNCTLNCFYTCPDLVPSNYLLFADLKRMF